ncbi:MAG: tyrosine--tRNA ligase [Candidatus Omnitrophica bacterium]|nr:tyrosine--tRNA ligase [Candidatus Omnitrophota bacterium]MCM8831856.1 tyrosine--tRNA ligase [Candidatus Omnitrophota bacterium]
MNLKIAIKEQLSVFKENTIDFISEDELIQKLEISISENKPLKLKIGFDPTACDIHLGHTVLLNKLHKLQKLGHIVYFVVGDFTAKIGDPSGRITQRPILTDEEIKKNASTYTSQIFKILDKSKTKIIYNSIWYKDMKLEDFLSILTNYTVARLLERDDFSKRLKENKPLTILEMIYPLIQGYDSVKLEADVEFGGSDQKFNLIVGRNLQQAFRQKPQVVITLPLLVGLDGKNKMSKSLDNYIGINETPKDMFGKIMSISDEVMWEYFRLLTDCNLDEIKKLHPKEAKLYLAQTLVSRYYSHQIAIKEKEEFERIFSKNQLPTQIPTYQAKADKIDILETLLDAKIVLSKNEARRLLMQGGIWIIDEKNHSSYSLKEQIIKIPQNGIVLKIGKKKFLKIIS